MKLKKVIVLIIFLCVNILHANLILANNDTIEKLEFLYLKSSQVIMRSGPGKTYKAIFIYSSIYEPMQIISRSQDWVEVRDYQNTSGWIHKSLLSQNKHIIITKTAKIKRWIDGKTIAIVHPYNKCKAIKLDDKTNKLKVKCNNITGYINLNKTWGF